MTSESSTAERLARLSTDPVPRRAPSSSFVLAPGYGLGGIVDAILGAVDPSPPPDREDAGDAYWMRRALLAAMAAEGRASPNPTVGAVIVKDGVLIATGATEAYGQRHAERCAIDNVADRALLRGATIYTTLEPCAHWGKQPPCADLVASCGFARCVAGLRDPNPRVHGIGLDRVRAVGTEVRSGVLRNEILAWHLPYLFPYLLPPAGGRPLVSALAVAGDGAEPLLGRADGWEARDAGRRYRSWLRRKCDLVVTEPSLASVDPVAFARGPWRGVVWWDLGDRLAGMGVAEARELGVRGRELGAPVTLVCTPDRENSAQLDACLRAGIGHLAPPADADPASWLAAAGRNGALAAVTGAPPAWVLVDGHPRLAAALAAGLAVDAVHALHPADAPPTSGGAAPARPAQPSTDLSPVARVAASGALISEYYLEPLSSALDGTAW
ncbi:Riboflavin biosynthesis protein RibD [Micromonospora sp. MW-13]|uniref:bifunctional diaminohydroxyphosphoribosylaminopyrimidine deaminase/5-amino-6-(5-phosphoribosylamino)uracil reductase RibD n=1 Tax=Micromonospora sp. MW-13 TaxID=2094022 RepID=UPI000E43E917|nr:bifunctional diaminohydroxyphosphoribosylaminopyrimidine deaminase/5-amino-6-(5-phosphoribosylamino)uracil reductase RibD [Micromonospora sp. MW-13]RGC68147.1 Riboflavin biosynthesis protein RibD [Micromonospora sp. MW-13]